MKIWKSLIQTDQRFALHSHTPAGLRIVTKENLDFVNCRNNEHYEQVKNAPNENY